MYEFHAWIGLSDSTFEQAGAVVGAAVRDLQELIERDTWPAAVFRIELLNGHSFLMMNGLINRRRAESQRMEELLALVVDRLPGSYGIVHDRDAAMPDPPGTNAFRVRVVARGRVEEQVDTFLSPIRPTIEE